MEPNPFPSQSCVCSPVEDRACPPVHACAELSRGQQVPYSIKTGSLTESGARLAARQSRWPSCLCPAQQVLLPLTISPAPPTHTHLLTPCTLEEGGRQTNLIVGLNCLAELRILKILIQNIKV